MASLWFAVASSGASLRPCRIRVLLWGSTQHPQGDHLALGVSAARGEMQIFVKTLTTSMRQWDMSLTGKTITLDVEPSDSVDDVKAQILTSRGSLRTSSG